MAVGSGDLGGMVIILSVPLSRDTNRESNVYSAKLPRALCHLRFDTQNQYP
jgi:hypothetical protein